MLSSFLWGLVGASSLVVGALIGLRFNIAPRALGVLLAFGAGALISAISFELATEALHHGGPGALAAGLALGGLSFYVGDRWLERRTRTRRGERSSTGGAALALGALLDGLPEQAAIGLSIAAGGSVGISLVAAIFISNVPESLGSSAELRRSGKQGEVLRIWLPVAVVTTLASVAGYVVLGGASGTIVGAVQAYAAGALIVMLIDEMVPEARGRGHPAVGLAALLGYAVAALLSHLTG
jgi:ZIP family zinc transporter